MTVRLSTFAEGLDHPEAVTITQDGRIFAGGEAGQVYEIDPRSGDVSTIHSTGGFILGVTADGNGRLYLCDLGLHQLIRLDPRTGIAEILSTGTTEQPMVAPNAAVFDDAGNLYVTDSGGWREDNGCIFKVTPDGETALWTRATSDFPNGACLDADGNTLWVAQSCRPSISSIRILDDGSAGDVEDIPVDGVPDGVAFDQVGDLYVNYYRPDRIERVTAGGARELVAEDPDGTMLSAPTNGAWIAPGVFVTANLGRWHLTKLEFDDEKPTGLRLRYPTIAM